MTKARDKKKKSGKAPKLRSPKQIAAQFKKGTINNPIGGNAHDPFKREIKALTSQALMDITAMTMTMSKREVEELLGDKERAGQLTLAQHTILRATLDASENGEIEKFNTIASRCIGQIPTVVHVESPNGTMSPNQLSEEELRKQINQQLDLVSSLKK